MSALRRIAHAIAACFTPRPICPLCREHLDEGDHDVCRFWLARP